MENATKALLIAAAVLIAIVIIALGVSLLTSTGDTTQNADLVGNELKNTIGSASDAVIESLYVKKMTPKEAFEFIQKLRPGINMPESGFDTIVKVRGFKYVGALTYGNFCTGGEHLHNRRWACLDYQRGYSKRLCTSI